MDDQGANRVGGRVSGYFNIIRKLFIAQLVVGAMMLFGAY